MYIYGSRPWRACSAGLPPKILASRPASLPAVGRPSSSGPRQNSPPLPRPLRFRFAPPSPPCAVPLAAARPRLGGRVMPIAGARGLSVPPLLPPARLTPAYGPGGRSVGPAGPPSLHVLALCCSPCGGRGRPWPLHGALRALSKSRAYARPGRRAVASQGIRPLRHCPRSACR